jgi:hypothetical protein
VANAEGRVGEVDGMLFKWSSEFGGGKEKPASSPVTRPAVIGMTQWLTDWRA